MSNLAAAFCHLSHLHKMTNVLKQFYLGQMQPQAIVALAEAIQFMRDEVNTPLSEAQLAKLSALLTPFTDYMQDNEDLGVIDGRSCDVAVLPGKTWLENAKDFDVQIGVNTLLNIATYIEAITSDSKEPSE